MEREDENWKQAADRLMKIFTSCIPCNDSGIPSRHNGERTQGLFIYFPR